MHAEQGYFTRAKKSKFTSEAGFAVVDVSEGIKNNENADIYIRSIGEAIVFDGKPQSENWLYAILPSRRDGKLSVTRAFPASDGRRTCHFSHTYLFDEKSAKDMLWNDMRSSKASRITGFCGGYVGEPGIREFEPPQIDNRFAPENIRFEDAGFTVEKMTALLNMIVILHENRGSNPNPLRGVFIVYNCGPDEFEKKAFSLLGMLYSCMPYDIMSQLGVVVKTDVEWRKDESYSSGYISAYMNNLREKKEYIPGGELYILNELLISAPADVCVITVKNDGDAVFSIKVETTPSYKPVFEDIVNYMIDGAGKSDSGLHEFYKFTSDIVGEAPSFQDICNLYQLADALRNPNAAVKNGLKYIVRILRLLNISMGKNFDKTDDYWKKQTHQFIFCLNVELLRPDFNEVLSEEACILLLKAEIKILSENLSGFIKIFYNILSKFNMLVPENEKLLSVLTGDFAGELKAITEMDRDAGSFLQFRDALIQRGKPNDLKILLGYFDVYETPIENNPTIHARLYRIVSDFSVEQTDDIQAVINKYKYSRGAVCAVLERLVEFKYYDINRPNECFLYFSQHDSRLTEELSIRKNFDTVYDAATVKFFIYKICAAPYEGDYNLFKKFFRKAHHGFLIRDYKDGLKSVKEFAAYLIRQRVTDRNFEQFMNVKPDNKYLFALIKYAEFDKELWTLRWDELINAAYAKANGNILDFTKVLKNTFDRVLNDVKINYETYLNIYGILCDKYLFPETSDSAKLFLDYARSIFNALNIYTPLPEDPEKDKQLRLLLASLFGKAARIFSNGAVNEKSEMSADCCAGCYCIIPADNSPDNNRDKCPVCKKKLPVSDKEHPLAEIITIDLETLEYFVKPYYTADEQNNNWKKSKDNNKDNIEDNGIFSFKINESRDTAEIFINGLSVRASEFFGADKNFMQRRERTCIIVELGEDDKTDVFEFLAENYFSYVCLIKKKGENLPALEFFIPKNEPAARQAGYESEDRNRARIGACASYCEGNRPDDMIKDLAQGLARYNMLKTYYKYRY